MTGRHWGWEWEWRWVNEWGYTVNKIYDKNQQHSYMFAIGRLYMGEFEKSIK